VTKPDDTLKFYEQTLSQQRAAGDRAGEANTLNDMVAIYYQNGDLDRTVPLLKRIIEVMYALGSVAEAATYHLNLGVVLQRLGRINEATTQVEQGRATLVLYKLPHGAGGATIADFDRRLAQLRGDAPPQPSVDAQVAEAIRLIKGADDEKLRVMAEQVSPQTVAQFIEEAKRLGDADLLARVQRVQKMQGE
jgi:hypothetical protein